VVFFSVTKTNTGDEVEAAEYGLEDGYGGGAGCGK